MTDATNGMQALTEYGYVMNKDGVMRDPRRARSQEWKPVPGGFLRFDAGLPMPHSLLPDFDGVSGLDYRLNPQCFTWLWPEPEVARIYIAAREAELERQREKAGAVARVEEPVTEEQVTAMVEAQEAAVPPAPKRKWFGR